MNPIEHARRKRLVNRLLKAQSRHEMTDKELTELIGLGHGTISGWRAGHVPTGKRVEAVQAAIQLLNEAEPGTPIKKVPPLAPIKRRYTRHKAVENGALPNLRTSCDLEMEPTEVVGYLKGLSKAQLGQLLGKVLGA